MVSNCRGERSFSKLKLIENRLRTSMKQKRLVNLVIMSIESDIIIFIYIYIFFFLATLMKISPNYRVCKSGHGGLFGDRRKTMIWNIIKRFKSFGDVAACLVINRMHFFIFGPAEPVADLGEGKAIPP